MTYRVLFVCLGNICRSPTAEAVFARHVAAAGYAESIEVDSCGTGGWHAGERAHPRTRTVAEARGVPITHRARQLRVEDFAEFDLIVAMDHANVRELERHAPDAKARQKVRLARDFDRGSPTGSAMPDPYHTGEFERVFELCEALSPGLLDFVLGELRGTRG